MNLFVIFKVICAAKMFESKCASASYVAHAEAQSLCKEVTENGDCDIKCIEGDTIASNTLKCKVVDVKIAVWIWTRNASCIPKSFVVLPLIANISTHFCGTILPRFCCLQLEIWIFFERIALQQERVLLEVEI